MITTAVAICAAVSALSCVACFLALHSITKKKESAIESQLDRVIDSVEDYERFLSEMSAHQLATARILRDLRNDISDVVASAQQQLTIN